VGRGQQGDQPIGPTVEGRAELDHLIEQTQLQLGFGVPVGDRREALGLGGRIGGAGHELVVLELEDPGQQGHRPLAGDGDPCLEVRDRHTRDGQSLGQFLLGPAQARAQVGNTSAQMVLHAAN